MDKNMYDVLAVIVSIISVVFSVYSFIRSRNISKHIVLKEYYNEENTEQKINARREIYNMSEEAMADLTQDDTIRALMSSYYQFYSSLYFNGIIDQKTFREIFGYAAVKLYHKLEPYIYARRMRKGDNQNYAWEFQKMVEDIERIENECVRKSKF